MVTSKQPTQNDHSVLKLPLLPKEKMNLNNFIQGVIIGAGAIIGLLLLLFLSWPFIYSYTENKNLDDLRKKSQLNCETMPLHCLVRDEKMDEISNYAISGKDLELKDNWGRTALYWALINDKPMIVHKLLSLNANPNTKDENGRSILYQTVAWGKFTIADGLLASGANIDIFNGAQYPETILHYCVMQSNPKCVHYLIDKGANIYLEDSFGYTVFERVKMHPHIGNEVGKLLEK